MFTTIFGFLSKKVFSSAGALLLPLMCLLAVFVLWNADGIAEKLGIETKSSIIKDRASLESDNKNLTEEIAKMEILIETLQAETEILEEILMHNVEQAVKTKETKDNIIEKRKERISIVKNEKETSTDDKDYEKKEVLIAGKKITKDQEISLANIEALHEAFDSFFGA